MVSLPSIYRPALATAVQFVITRLLDWLFHEAPWHGVNDVTFSCATGGAPQR